MVKSFNCTCGNKDTSKVVEYDGALGYEALVCKVCGTYYDFDPATGKPRTNPPDKWSKGLVGIKDNVSKVSNVKNPIDLIDKYDRFQTDGDGDVKIGN